MKIGFDVDGIFADFVTKYQKLVVQLTNKDLFLPGDMQNPPCWSWPEMRGYTSTELSRVWDSIKANPTFWMNLDPIKDAVDAMNVMVESLERNHDVYYVTSRPGIRAKRQSEIWLFECFRRYYHLNGVWPTVLISSNKGGVAKALGLDVYVDDYYENVNNVAVTSPTTRTYLLTKSYNLGTTNAPKLNPSVIRVGTLGQLFDREIHNL